MQQEYAALASEVSDITQGTTYNGIPLLSGGNLQFQVGDGQAGSVLSVSTAGLSSTPSFGDISSQSGAQGAVGAIDSLLGSVNGFRAGLGANMNRLSAVSSNLGNSIYNTTSAESQIRDTDYASQSTQLALAQILNNSSTAMLAQANMLPQGVMRLL